MLDHPTNKQIFARAGWLSMAILSIYQIAEYISPQERLGQQQVAA